MQLNRWTVGTRLWLLTGFLMLDLVLVGLAEARVGLKLGEQVRDLVDSHLPAVQQMTLLDMRHDGLRAIVLEGEVAILKEDTPRAQRAQREAEELTGTMREGLRTLSEIKLPPQLAQAIASLRPQVERYIELARAALTPSPGGREEGAADPLGAFVASFELLKAKLEEVGSGILAEARLAQETTDSMAQGSLARNLGLLGLGLATGLVATIWVVGSHVRGLRSLVAHLTREARQVAEGAVQVNEASQGLSHATVEQASALEETVASMEEMTATISRTAEHAVRSQTTSQRGEEEAQRGKKVMAHMVTAMGGIEEANSRLESLVKLIREIESKTQVINDIVFETRLLSFNASIEAARAGAHGKGFSVVAEEVGKLALLSGRAADEIRALLESSTAQVSGIVRSNQEKVTAAREAFRQCEETFGSMGESLQQIRDSVVHIATAAQQQEVGVKQTNAAMVAIDHATQDNSRSAESLAALALELERGASSLKDTIREVERMVAAGRAVDDGARSEPGANSGRAPPPGSLPPATRSASSSPLTGVVRSDSRWQRSPGNGGP